MTKLSQDALKILNFWQDSLWQNFANQFPIFEKNLPFHAVSSADIRSGQISLPQIDDKLWIAPVVWENTTKPKHLWIPLWIPAYYAEGKLLPRYDEHPFVPPSQFDIMTDYFLFTESIHELDAILRFDWEAPAAEESTSWTEFYTACFGLLDSLSHHTWQERLKLKGYIPIDKAYIAESQTLRAWHPFMQRYNDLLNQEEGGSLLESYARIKDPMLDYIDSENEVEATFCGRYSESLTHSEYQAVTKSLTKEEGLFAIASPVGSGKERVMCAIVSSLIVTRTVIEESLPVIYRLARSSNQYKCLIEPFTLECLYPKGKKEEREKIVELCLALNDGQSVDKENLSKSLIHQLRLQYENYITGLNLLENVFKEKEDTAFGKEDDPKQYLQALQHEDEVYETEFVELLAIQSQMQQKKPDSLFSRLFSWRQSKKAAPQRYATLEEVGERIRQVKVLRAKIHLQLVTVTDKMVTSTHGKLWQQWLNENQLELPENTYKKEDLLTFVKNAFSEKLWLLTVYYWQTKNEEPSQTAENDKSSLYPGWHLCQLKRFPYLGWHVVDNIATSADLILIDESNRLLPQQIAPFLANVKKAIFFGDEKDIPPLMATSLLEQERKVQLFGLEEDEVREQMHYKGMMISAGNAFQVALRNTDVQEEDSLAPALFLQERNVNAIFQDYLSLVNNNKREWPALRQENKAGLSAFNIQHVHGKCEYRLEGYVNQDEAQSVIDWLKQGPYANQENEIIIVTPFAAQKQLLKALISQHHLHYPVVTFYELEAQSWDCVVFSPVYTCDESRPFVFDQGDNWIYSLVVRAKEALWIIGDTKIFDPKTHSPSGCIAKVVLA